MFRQLYGTRYFVNCHEQIASFYLRAFYSSVQFFLLVGLVSYCGFFLCLLIFPESFLSGLVQQVQSAAADK